MQYLTSLSILIYLEEYPIEVRDKIGTDQDNMVSLTFHYKYLSPALNSLGKGNEFEREGGRVNFFLGMSNSVIQFHHYPECRVELEKGPSEGS